MSNRHLSRSIVLQSLFEWDFNMSGGKDISDIIARNVKEFAPGIKNYGFFDELSGGILAKQEKLDEIIVKAAPDWPIEKISITDRNILRIGLYELLFGNRNEVPPKVAINEAIELAKTFGGENSGRFINGVLGAVYKELGEPGKNDKRKKNNVSHRDMPIEKLIGAVVYAYDGEEIYLGLIHDVFGRWTLTKGHLMDGESEKDGVLRKAKEEMGAMVISVEDNLGENEYIASSPDKGKVRKRVSYYLAQANFDKLTAGDSGGIDGAQWFKLSDVSGLNVYDDILPIVIKGIDLLLKK